MHGKSEIREQIADAYLVVFILDSYDSALLSSFQVSLPKRSLDSLFS